jgi:hypothetical protein
MAVLTVTEISNHRTALSSKTAHESLSFLSKVGHYYEQTLPSKMEHSFIFETEKLVNDLYLKSLQEAALSSATAPLLEALGQVGSMAISVKNKSFGSDFVKTTKQLGRTLIRLGRMK